MSGRAPASSLWTRSRGVWVLCALAAVVAGVVTVLLAVSAGVAPYRALGSSDPGAVVRLGTPVLRLVVDVAAAMCVGSLAFAVLLTPPRDLDGRKPSMSGTGYRALSAATWWAVLWCGAAFVLTTFTAASGAGVRLSAISSPTRWAGLVGAQEEPRAWLVSCALAAILAIGCRLVLTWRPLVALLVVGIVALLPPLATGHSSSDTGHDLATAAIMIHVPAAAVWLGLLVTVLARLRRGGADVDAAAARYARVATVCWLLVVGSGLVDAAVLVPGGNLAASRYGRALIVKVAVVAVVGILGGWARRRAIRATQVRRDRRPVVALLAVELVLLSVALGVSAELAQLSPPAFARPVSIEQTLLGYDLAGPPTLARLALDWRVEVLFGSVAVGLAAVYLLGVWRLRRCGQRWPAAYTAGWLGGCAVLLVATCSGIGRYEPAMLSVHMASHMLVGFVVPLLLAQGAPLTLAVAAYARTPAGLPGIVDWTGAMTRSRPAAVVTHPVVALALFVGSPFALYFTSLFDAAARFHWAHIGIDVYFLLVGYLFVWPIVGTDRAPRPLPNLARLGMLLAATPFTAAFAALLIGSPHVIGNGAAGGNMYSSLALPWVPNLLADQRVGGVIALAIGEAALFVATLILLVRWRRIDEDPEASGLTQADDLISASGRSPAGPVEPA